MISANFYPTQTTQFNTEYTNTIPNLDYTDPEEIAASYYMGYINYEDIPPVLKASYCKFVYNDTEAYVEFTDITNAENVPWFFTGIYSTSGNTSSHAYYRLNTDTNKYVTNSDMSGMGHWGFLNSLQIERVSYRENFSLTFTIQFLDMSTNPPVYNSNTYVDSDTKVFSSYSDVEDFLSNTTPLSFTYTKYGETYTAEIYARDIESGYYEVITTNGYLWRFYLTDFSNFIPERDMQPNGTMANYSNIGVGTLMHYNHPTKGVIPLLNNLFSWHYPPAENRYLNIIFNAKTRDAYNGRWVDSWTALGGFQCKIPYAFFLNASYYQVAQFGNCIIVKMGNDINYLKRVFTLNEVLKTYVYMFTRLTTTISTAYGFNDDMKIPLFNDDNSPMWDYVSGELEDIQSQLQPWQYTNITTNTFTEDDIPEYEPPSPSGGEDEESGQSIPIQRRLSMGAVSSFITCYGLTAAQVQEFGKKLWSSWVDNGGLVMAMVENFKFLIDSGIASNTGSIDISSVLDFVVSLKVYPCDIRNLFAFSNSDSDGKVYIGRGTYGLEVSNSAIYKAINQLGYLDAGTYNVPRPFGDFRDYTNINITVYVPYCGTIELNPADVIGRTLSGTYVVDVMTGECTFFLEVVAVTDNGEHRYIVGTCDGQLGITIPVSATNSGQIAARRFSDVAQFATTVGGFFNRNMQIGNDIAMQMATLGASGMASKNPEMASTREQNIKMTGSQAYADNALGLLKDVTGQFGNSLTRAAIDAPNISGGSGIASFANPDCVWIQIRHGIYPKVDNYNHTVGKVSTKSAPLSSYHGFTVCHNVDVSSLPCTEEEKSAIKQLLETGVYL